VREKQLTVANFVKSLTKVYLQWLATRYYKILV